MPRLYFFIILFFAQGQFAISQAVGAKPGKPVKSSHGSTQNQVIDSVRFIPKAIGWTNDFKKLFSREEVANLDSLISVYERKTTVEIAVATIDSSMMGPLDFESYTLLMLRTWGVGKKESNNGVLIVIAPDLKRVRIQNGYGIEKILSNENTRVVIDSVMMPAFRRNNFFNGTKEGILAIIGKLEAKRQ